MKCSDHTSIHTCTHTHTYTQNTHTHTQLQHRDEMFRSHEHAEGMIRNVTASPPDRRTQTPLVRSVMASTPATASSRLHTPSARNAYHDMDLFALSGRDRQTNDKDAHTSSKIPATADEKRDSSESLPPNSRYTADDVSRSHGLHAHDDDDNDDDDDVLETQDKSFSSDGGLGERKPFILDRSRTTATAADTATSTATATAMATATGRDLTSAKAGVALAREKDKEEDNAGDARDAHDAHDAYGAHDAHDAHDDDGVDVKGPHERLFSALRGGQCVAVCSCITWCCTCKRR
jgi:hypothetical protein